MNITKNFKRYQSTKKKVDTRSDAEKKISSLVDTLNKKIDSDITNKLRTNQEIIDHLNIAIEKMHDFKDPIIEVKQTAINDFYEYIEKHLTEIKEVSEQVKKENKEGISSLLELKQKALDSQFETYSQKLLETTDSIIKQLDTSKEKASKETAKVDEKLSKKIAANKKVIQDTTKTFNNTVKLIGELQEELTKVSKRTIEAKEIRDKLESLKGKERLDAKAIKNLEKAVIGIWAQGGGGVGSFIALDDTPPSYADPGDLVVINPTGDGLAFVDISTLEDADWDVVGADMFNIPQGGVYSEGTHGAGTIQVTGAGSRMMWLPHLSSFAAGEAVGGGWNNIGNYSAVFGRGNNAVLDYSFIAGNTNSIGDGTHNVIFGDNNLAENISHGFIHGSQNEMYGTYDFLFGNQNIAENSYNFAHGDQNEIYADYGVAFGSGNTIDPAGDYTVMFGNGNYARSPYNLILGTNNQALTSGFRGIMLGDNNITEIRSGILMGTGNSAQGFSSIVGGTSNGAIQSLDVNNSIILGNNNETPDTSGASGAIVTGNNNKLFENTVGAIIVGNNNQVDGVNSFVLGQGINANTGYEFVLGNGTTMFRLGVTGNTWLRSDTSFNIGVGTNAPTRFLDIAGDTRLRADLYDGNDEPGTAGQVLSSLGAGNGTDWVDAGSAITSFTPSIRTTGVDTIITDTDYTIDATTTTADITVTLPAIAGRTGRVYVIKNNQASNPPDNVIVDGNAAETIDGALTYTLNRGDSVTLQCNGSEWIII